MSRIIGFGVGVVFVIFSLWTFRNSAMGWGEGHTDLGLWWAVTGTLLAIAAVVIFVGTTIHTRPSSR